jgi:glycosyltransferase involved in cell wall biosynthesis
MNLPRGGQQNSNRQPRVLVVASHPIQYQAPWFRALSSVSEIDFSVLFIAQPDPTQQGRGFGVAFQWDIPLLDGYRWQLAPGVDGLGATARLRSLGALLRELAPDAVLITGWHVRPLLQLLFAAWFKRVPVIMRGEANALRGRPLPVRLWHRLILGRCAAFLPIGKASKAFYRSYGIAERRLFDAPYFVDNERFGTAAAQLLERRAGLRERWGIPHDAICYCYAGKLEPKKRILDLLRAIQLAKPRASHPLHLLVVGAGELQPQAKATAAELDLPVTFAGFLNQSEIPAAYVAADCLVLPSDYGETWGLVVNEAMACGRPAIVSDRVGCAEDLVIEGKTGSVFPFGNIEALAKRLVKHADPDMLRSMGEQARAHVVAGYSISKSVQGTLDAVRYVLAPA